MNGRTICQHGEIACLCNECYNEEIEALEIVT